ncbi:MAG: thiamine phosphate synthase [Prolixibacteraceae bacterium]|nr:thiamine phosphate synthase [Prolixibacteraceae bacterium]
MEDSGIYIIITHPALPYRTIAEDCVSMGIKMLQLREKDIPDGELLRIAKELREITRGTQTSLVIDDRPDIAALCQADYLHIGQSDLPIEEARKIVGNMKIGLSTHSIVQVKESLKKNPDYIGFGPVFPTPTKAIADPAVGTELIKEVMSISNIPVVVLGGLFPENISSVIKAGAKNVALVRYFMETKDFKGRVQIIKDKF